MLNEFPDEFFVVDNPEDYEEDVLKELEKHSERMKEEVKSLPEDREEYFDQFVEECNKVFDINFVDYECDENHKQDFWLVLEDENGEKMGCSANPLEYARYELHNGMSYVETLKSLN